MMNMHSRLLIDEPPLQLIPSLAVALGNRPEDAIVLQQLHYWLQRSTNEHEGRRWVYNSYQEWIDQDFPFFTVNQISDIFKRLRALGVVVAKQINVKQYDRRYWYSIDYSALNRLHGDGKPTGPNLENSSLEPVNTQALHLAEITTEITTQSIGANAPNRAPDATPTPDSTPDSQPSKKKRGANRKGDTLLLSTVASPAPAPLDFQQRAARAALDERPAATWDDLPSASSAPSLPLPPGSVGDLDAALETVCYGTQGDRETWALYGGQIRKARKDIREANKTLRIPITGQEIRERFGWPDGDWYVTYMARDEAGDFTRKPTPASVVKHVRALDNARVAQERTPPGAYTNTPAPAHWPAPTTAPATPEPITLTEEDVQRRLELARRSMREGLEAARARRATAPDGSAS